MLEDRLEFARRIAVEAGKFTLNYYRQASLTYERKADDSPVTVADRGAESLLRERLAERFPDDAILGEEHGETKGKSEYRWILDPIDGTKSFITGVPLYGTLVGMEAEGQPALGVVYFPVLDECYFAAVGGGAWLSIRGGEPARIKASATTKLSDCVFVTSQVDSFAVRKSTEVFEKLQSQCYITRTWGDCFGHMLVASGRADIMVDPLMNIWDAAPLLPIVTEAGGRYCDWNGNATITGKDALSAAPGVIEQVLELTRG